MTLTREDLAEGLALARQLEESDADFAFETITGKPVTAMTVLGDALRLNGELSRAKSVYEKSVRLTQGKDRHSLAHLADGLLREGQTEEAITVLQQYTSADEMGRLNACASLLRSDPNSLTSFRSALDQHLDGSDVPP